MLKEYRFVGRKVPLSSKMAVLIINGFLGVSPFHCHFVTFRLEKCWSFLSFSGDVNILME